MSDRKATVCHLSIRQRQDMNTDSLWRIHGDGGGLCSKFPSAPAPAKDILNSHVKKVVYVQNVRSSTELHLVTRLQEVRRIQIAVEGQDPFYLKTGSPWGVLDYLLCWRNKTTIVHSQQTTCECLLSAFLSRFRWCFVSRYQVWVGSADPEDESPPHQCDLDQSASFAAYKIR